ncbi:hypothetical protein OCAE111667_23630 [Occultella aeris]|uniref:Uncharacterized protein n=1 Tax=Occultella aeris TaxID=2761496 RepID=A0A7M4DHJ3_9MICO|nr:hypothetical protein [Occultella aeris]VZO36386.1 hypothetical protein HALOF300_01591 [Occultella aeris]
MVNEDDKPSLVEYVGIIWIGDEPGLRFRVEATSPDEARAWVIQEFGEGHVFSLWNEERASRLR